MYQMFLTHKPEELQKVKELHEARLQQLREQSTQLHLPQEMSTVVPDQNECRELETPLTLPHLEIKQNEEEARLRIRQEL